MKPITVAQLIDKLAGLPPMMEVFVEAAGEQMYINNGEVIDQATPVLLLICNTYLDSKVPIYDKTYEEAVAEKKQQAMQMQHEKDKAQKMPEMVE